MGDLHHVDRTEDARRSELLLLAFAEIAEEQPAQARPLRADDEAAGVPAQRGLPGPTGGGQTIRQRSAPRAPSVPAWPWSTAIPAAASRSRRA